MLKLVFYQIHGKLHFPNISFQFLPMNLMFGHKVTSGEDNISSFNKLTVGGHVTLRRGKYIFENGVTVFIYSKNRLM